MRSLLVPALLAVVAACGSSSSQPGGDAATDGSASSSQASVSSQSSSTTSSALSDSAVGDSSTDAALTCGYEANLATLVFQATSTASRPKALGLVGATSIPDGVYPLTAYVTYSESSNSTTTYQRQIMARIAGNIFKEIESLPSSDGGTYEIAFVDTMSIVGTSINMTSVCGGFDPNPEFTYENGVLTLYGTFNAMVFSKM